jgi:hypothetical protein
MLYPAGLDVQNRPTLLELLRSLHSVRNPRVIIGLRTQDPVPDWITHVAFVRGGTVTTGLKDEVLSTVTKDDMAKAKTTSRSSITTAPQGKLLVEMKNVNVKYGPRTVSSILEMHIVAIHANPSFHVRYSKTLTGKSGRATDGTSKALTVFLSFYTYRHHLTLSTRLRKNYPSLPAHRRPPPILHAATPTSALPPPAAHRHSTPTLPRRAALA